MRSSAFVLIRPHSSAFISIHPVGALLRSDIQPFDCSADGGLLFTVLRLLSSGCGATIHCSAVTILRLWRYYTVLRSLSCGCGVTILFCGHYPAVVALLYCSAATILRLWRYYTVLRSWCSVIYYHFHSPAINYSIFFVSFGMNGNNLNNVRDEIRLLWVFFSLT